jgi:hypothetical protein
MRIEDGIFTEVHTTTGDIEDVYQINSSTRGATQSDLDLMPGTYGIDGNSVTNIGDPIYNTPAMAGKAVKVYTNGVGGTNGQPVTFKLWDGQLLTVTVYSGMMLPIASIGCDTPGLIVFG